ncbi:unnamed protein product [Linum trigynum]|uniref:Uncharacterized protein n=1 Tax=Linum trigynum TaxID=586398 RepID=A0AAV2CUV8_9ROSI
MAAISWADGVGNKPDPRPHLHAPMAAGSAMSGSKSAAFPPLTSATASPVGTFAVFVEEGPPPVASPSLVVDPTETGVGLAPILPPPP